MAAYDIMSMYPVAVLIEERILCFECADKRARRTRPVSVSVIRWDHEAAAQAPGVCQHCKKPLRLGA